MVFFIFEVAMAVIPGSPAQALGHMGGGVAQHGELQVTHGLLGDHVEAPEGEEEVNLSALTQCGIGQDQPGIGHVQVALGTDDGDLSPGADLSVEVRDDGRSGFCGAHAWFVPFVGRWESDAAVWLRQP